MIIPATSPAIKKLLSGSSSLTPTYKPLFNAELNSSLETPVFSSSNNLPASSLAIPRVAPPLIVEPTTAVPVSVALITALRQLSPTGLSLAIEKIVPHCTPSAPAMKASTTPRPSPIPPAAINGMLMASAI